MKIAAVQFLATGSTKDNMQACLERIRTAAENGARLVVLPEAASQAFGTGRLDTQAENLEGSYASALRAEATRLGVTVVAGTFRPADTIERDGKTINRVYNTALITGPDLHTGYDKIHTYDAFSYRESDTVKPGTQLCTFDVDGVTIGVATCYDIRFPEQFRELARAGAKVIVVPFSWADGPGKLEQWRLLSAARALDSTSYLVAAGQARPGGQEQAGQDSGPTGIGHSVIVSPTGVRLAEAGYDEEIIYADLDIERVAAVRKQLPVLG
ncbi:carbon-nitrogen hydrolase family protein [Corynebacterium lizhenjunii]|uniref:carbon-nitrogen hydrolase family protein n=1 Tax=Corynebacterium lizhenjunii TaxID=2709394 RepID=UPI0013E9D78A|nr:carbon-nitrogen hydrolase family protein [Corynebacterium lizhenjunii]